MHGSLLSLNLDSNEITNVIELVRSLTAIRLQELILSNNPIGDDGLDAFATLYLGDYDVLPVLGTLNVANVKSTFYGLQKLLLGLECDDWTP